ncbi:transposase [Shewanella sp.]|uniref:transposase n=1 Tax=Shewanella sp. TaxID=50422 RepID=UPI0034595BAF
MSGFKNGRHAAVFVGVTPKQHSSGGKVVMIGIDKHGGDKYLRSILYQPVYPDSVNNATISIRTEGANRSLVRR